MKKIEKRMKWFPRLIAVSVLVIGCGGDAGSEVDPTEVGEESAAQFIDRQVCGPCLPDAPRSGKGHKRCEYADRIVRVVACVPPPPPPRSCCTHCEGSWPGEVRCFGPAGELQSTRSCLWAQPTLPSYCP